MQRTRRRGRSGNAPFTVISGTRCYEDGYLDEQLGPQVKQIHISGTPFVWLLDRIIKQCPHLKLLQTVENNKVHLERGRAVALLATRGDVQVRYGTVRPPWDRARRESPSTTQYSRRQKLLKNLTGRQRELWDELLRHKVRAAEFTARYFCLNDEPFVTLGRLALQLGFCENPTLAGNLISSVFLYLDLDTKCSIEARKMVGSIERAVNRARAMSAEGSDADVRSKLCQELDIPRLPDKLPTASLNLFRQVYLAYEGGKFSVFADDFELEGSVLMAHYGIGAARCKKLSEIARDHKPRRTREWARQKKSRALRMLGITEE